MSLAALFQEALASRAVELPPGPQPGRGRGRGRGGRGGRGRGRGAAAKKPPAPAATGAPLATRFDAGSGDSDADADAEADAGADLDSDDDFDGVAAPNGFSDWWSEFTPLPEGASKGTGAFRRASKKHEAYYEGDDGASEGTDLDPDSLDSMGGADYGDPASLDRADFADEERADSDKASDCDAPMRGGSPVGSGSPMGGVSPLDSPRVAPGQPFGSPSPAADWRRKRAPPRPAVFAGPCIRGDGDFADDW